jgi:hypothetical protein
MRRRSFRQRRANGHDRIARQAYLGHRNIQHTVRYTELSPMRFKNFWRASLLTNVPLVPRCSCLTANRGRVWGLHDDEEITAARVHCCRKGSNGKGRAMRPRTRRDGRNYSSLCAIRRQSFGIGRHIGAPSWRLWGKLNAIGSSPGILARWHTWTGRFLACRWVYGRNKQTQAASQG